jgi:DNA-binding XRE family transcriptional regulator
MKNKPLQQFSLEEITDKYIGEKGSEKRDAFENELRLDLLGEALKQTRIKQKLTQEELGKLVGVQKSQISKLENSVKDARFETVLKVFKALNTRITFQLELEETTY